VQGFSAGTGANMILNTMAWLRCEVVALPNKQATSAAGTVEQIDAAGNTLGIGHFLS